MQVLASCRFLGCELAACRFSWLRAIAEGFLGYRLAAGFIGCVHSWLSLRYFAAKCETNNFTFGGQSQTLNQELYPYGAITVFTNKVSGQPKDGIKDFLRIKPEAW